MIRYEHKNYFRRSYADTVPHVLHSVSKTFTATAVGLAIADGKLALTDKVIDFFPDKLPAEVNDNLKAMTVRDLQGELNLVWERILPVL